MALIKEHGWTDIGNDESKCHGKPGRATCKTNQGANESRIGFILANDRMTPAIARCMVDDNSDYPTYLPLTIEIITKLLETTSKELKKPTNFAWMFNQKIEKQVEETQAKREEEKAKGNDDFKGEQEHSIRKRGLDSLHKAIDTAIGKKKHRLSYAVRQRDTSMQWDLIVAAVEEGVIEFFELKGKEATKMKGRSKITFAKWTKRLLKGIAFFFYAFEKPFGPLCERDLGAAFHVCGFLAFQLEELDDSLFHCCSYEVPLHAGVF